MNFNIKLVDALKSIEFGSIQDDAVYLRFVLGKGQVGHKLIGEIKADVKYICTLHGENDIINHKGENVTGVDQYLSYAKKGRVGLDFLNFNKKAYLYVVPHNAEETPGFVFDKISDIKAFFESKEKEVSIPVL